MIETEKILTAVRAAFEHESRINLHHYPVRVEWSGGSLLLDGEVENITAKKLALARLAYQLTG